MRIGNVVYNLAFDGVPWHPDFGHVEYLTVTNHMHFALPQVAFKIADVTQSIGNRINLKSGTIMQLEYGLGNNIRTYEFYLYSVQGNDASGAVIYVGEGHLNLLSWFYETTTKAYRGSTSEAITQLAEECQLSVDVDATNDQGKMPWLGGGKKRFAAAREWAKSGWVNNESLMQLAFAGSTAIHPHVLRYKNLNGINRDDVAAYFTAGSFVSPQNVGTKSNPFPITSSLEQIDGAAESYDGSKGVMYDQDFDGEATSERHDKIFTKVPAGSVLNNNDRVRDQIESSRIVVAGIKSDNTFTQYNQAKYQNVRGMEKMFATQVAITTHIITEVRIFDIVELQYSGSNRGAGDVSDRVSNHIFDGRYFVAARSIKIKKTNYGEKFLLFRNDLNYQTR